MKITIVQKKPTPLAFIDLSPGDWFYFADDTEPKARLCLDAGKYCIIHSGELYFTDPVGEAKLVEKLVPIGEVLVRVALPGE